ncbi:MAG: YlxR family protein [Oscillospiraceae bacterium]|jgi:predicted RNA-binding protein YlxR (DUF448 family)|nr:YlxR family protein [Oscillospiraceae bacterium]
MRGDARPVRRCAGCGERSEKKTLIRVARESDGGVSVDLTGKKPGRGAYVHGSESCLKTARKKKSLERVLKCRVPDEVYHSLEREITGKDSDEQHA